MTRPTCYPRPGGGAVHYQGCGHVRASDFRLEPCCPDGPPGHSQQQHHDASPCYDLDCPFNHPYGGPYPHPEDDRWPRYHNGAIMWSELEEWQRPVGCPLCGAAVTDTDTHERWHEEGNR